MQSWAARSADMPKHGPKEQESGRSSIAKLGAKAKKRHCFGYGRGRPVRLVRVLTCRGGARGHQMQQRMG